MNQYKVKKRYLQQRIVNFKTMIFFKLFFKTRLNKLFESIPTHDNVTIY